MLRENQNGKKCGDEEFLDWLLQIERQELLSAPKYLKENILNESMSLSAQVNIKGKYLSARMQLFLYGMKVSVAVLCGIIMLGISSFHPGTVNDSGESIIFSGLKESQYGFVMENDNGLGILENKLDRTEKEGVTVKINKVSNYVTESITNFTDGLMNYQGDGKSR